nr:prolipoprotein diacylglyceryl transferase [Jongsikchunia kroppenstedtii]
MTQSDVLAYIPSPPQGVWHLAGVPIRAYALFIIVGIIVAVFWGNRRWIARGGRDGEVLDIAIWAVPFGLIGGRLYHLATDWNTYFGDGGKQPIDALKVWDGGLGIWGAVLLGAFGAWLGTRHRGISLPAFGDAIGPPILLAQAIGRLGNYFNQELFGADTTMPWGLKIYERTPVLDPDSPWTNINGHSTGEVVRVVQPTFLYELVWNLLVVIALVIIDRRFRIGHGRLFAMYVAGYCAGRFVIEALRHDYATHIFGLRINLFTAALVFLAASIYILLAPRGRETPVEVYRPGRAPEEYYDDADDEDEADGATADGDTVDGDTVDGDTVDGETADGDTADDTDFEAIADDYADELDESEKPPADETDEAKPTEPEPDSARDNDADGPEADEPDGDDAAEPTKDETAEPAKDETAESADTAEPAKTEDRADEPAEDTAAEPADADSDDADADDAEDSDEDEDIDADADDSDHEADAPAAEEPEKAAVGDATGEAKRESKKASD